MQKITVLTSAWQTWLDTNLARGCSVDSLVDAMVRENFAPQFALASVQRVQAAQSQAQPDAQGINPSGHQAYSDQVAPQQQLASAAKPPLPTHYLIEPARLKHHGNIIQTDDRTVHLSFHMARPVVALMDDLLSQDECDELIRLSRLKLQRSTIVDPITGKTAVIADRSSYGTFFNLNENDFIARLDHRIAQAMNWPVENGEGLQMLHYEVGGEYKPHFDFFPPADSGSAVHLAQGGQRVSTLVIYLNRVESGGETIFPEINLSVVPKPGSAIYFEYCNSLGQVDSSTLHGGLPVLQGEKWIATKWMRQRRYGPAVTAAESVKK